MERERERRPDATTPTSRCWPVQLASTLAIFALGATADDGSCQPARFLETPQFSSPRVIASREQHREKSRRINRVYLKCGATKGLSEPLAQSCVMHGSYGSPSRPLATQRAYGPSQVWFHLFAQNGGLGSKPTRADMTWKRKHPHAPGLRLPSLHHTNHRTEDGG